MKTKKEKTTVRIVSPYSEHYVEDKTIKFSIDDKRNTPKQKSMDRKSIKDLKNINCYKLNSKKIQSRQNHSPVYE